MTFNQTDSDSRKLIIPSGIERRVALSGAVPRWCFVARVLGQLRPLRVFQVVVEILGLGLHLGDLFPVLVEDMLAYEIGTLELFTTEWAQPLIFRQFLRIGQDELLYLTIRKLMQ